MRANIYVALTQGFQHICTYTHEYTVTCDTCELHMFSLFWPICSDWWLCTGRLPSPSHQKSEHCRVIGKDLHTAWEDVSLGNKWTYLRLRTMAVSLTQNISFKQKTLEINSKIPHLISFIHFESGFLTIFNIWEKKSLTFRMTLAYSQP